MNDDSNEELLIAYQDSLETYDKMAFRIRTIHWLERYRTHGPDVVRDLSLYAERRVSYAVLHVG